MSLKDDAIEVAVVVALIGGVVWYVERKYQAAGGVTGLSSALFSWAGSGLSNIGGAVLDAMPSSQVPAAVDTVQAGVASSAAAGGSNTATTGEYLWESALMGGGS